MLDFLSNIDSEIFLFFNNGLRSSFMDQMMMLFTGRFIWIPMYAAILLLLMRPLRWKAALTLTLALAAAIALTDQTCATFIRPLVERLRPSNPENPLSVYVRIVDNYRGGAYGFPSCHAANSFALATFMTLLVRRRGFIAFIVTWAVLNSYSRLYLGVHYPGDLLAGAAIGCLFGTLFYHMAARIIRRSKLASRNQLTEPLFAIPIGISISSVLHIRTFGVGADTIVIAIGMSTALAIILASVL